MTKYLPAVICSFLTCELSLYATPTPLYFLDIVVWGTGPVTGVKGPSGRKSNESETPEPLIR